MSRLLLFALIAVPACGPRPVPTPEPGPQAKTEKPRLAVLVVFDQMRGDYPSRWRELYGKDGLVRLTDGGAWFQNCHYPYANTLTAAGHATMSTGAVPAVHGVIANDWYVPGPGNTQNAVTSMRFEQVPPVTAKPKPNDKPRQGGTPELLLAPSFGEALKKATAGLGKVVALSLKPRSAILPAGRRDGKSGPDAVYWADNEGRFVTSTYYRDAPHAWVRELNASGLSLSWMGKEWTRLRPDVDYDRHAGPDDGEGEGVKDLLTRTFPHAFDGGKKKDKAGYIDQLGRSPMGSEWLLAAVKKAVEAEGLGTRDVPDFLSVSFSSNDLVGHAFGPDSHEVLDATLRADLIVRDLLGFLDEKVGAGRYVLVMTADHGICPLPEASRGRKIDAGRIPIEKFMETANAMLEARWPGPPTKKTPKWIEASPSLMLYLDRKIIATRGAKPDEVAETLAKWLPTQPGIQAAYTHSRLSGEMPQEDAIGRMVQASFHPDRSGDVMLVLKPHYLFSDKELRGTTHGSPHPYDTWVPLVAYGAGVKPGVREGRVSPQAAAVILAAGLGIAPPAKAAVEVPHGLFAE